MKLSLIKHIKLFLQNVLSFGLGISGIIIALTVKIFGFVCFIFVDEWIRPLIGNWVFIPAIIAFWLGAALWYSLFKLLFPKDFIESGYPITNKFGADFPKPNYKDYGITEDDWEVYRNRFDFETSKFIVQVVIGVSGLYYLFSKIELMKCVIGISFLTGGLMLVYAVHYLFEYLDERNKQKLPQYEKIKRYQNDVHIYFAIQSEK